MANGVVYATTGMGHGKLVALDATTGDVLFSDFVGDGDGSGDGEWVAADATISDGAIYIGSTRTTMACWFGSISGGEVGW